LTADCKLIQNSNGVYRVMLNTSEDGFALEDATILQGAAAARGVFEALKDGKEHRLTLEIRPMVGSDGILSTNPFTGQESPDTEDSIILRVVQSAPTTTQAAPPDASPQTKDNPPEKQAKFGEEVRVGDLLISVSDVTSGHCDSTLWGGVRLGDYTRGHLTVRNTSAGKVVDWSGSDTLDHATAADEHGNRFRPVEMKRMWETKPGNGWQTASAYNSVRMMPGMTYESSVFFEDAPPTSKQVIITLQIEGTPIRFSGPVEYKK
jgi:hypothetical protein